MDMAMKKFVTTQPTAITIKHSTTILKECLDGVLELSSAGGFGGFVSVLALLDAAVSEEEDILLTILTQPLLQM